MAICADFSHVLFVPLLCVQDMITLTLILEGMRGFHSGSSLSERVVLDFTESVLKKLQGLNILEVDQMRFKGLKII